MVTLSRVDLSTAKGPWDVSAVVFLRDKFQNRNFKMGVDSEKKCRVILVWSPLQKERMNENPRGFGVHQKIGDQILLPGGRC